MNLLRQTIQAIFGNAHWWLGGQWENEKYILAFYCEDIEAIGWPTLSEEDSYAAMAAHIQSVYG